MMRVVKGRKTVSVPARVSVSVSVSVSLSVGVIVSVSVSVSVWVGIVRCHLAAPSQHTISQHSFTPLIHTTLIQGTSSTLDGGEEEVYLVHLNGLTDRDVAAKLRGHQVFVRDDERKQKVPTLALTLPRSYDRSTTLEYHFFVF